MFSTSAAPAVSLDALLKSLPAVRSAAKSPSRLQHIQRATFTTEIVSAFLVRPIFAHLPPKFLMLLIWYETSTNPSQKADMFHSSSSMST